jgi:hypothetical protein
MNRRTFLRVLGGAVAATAVADRIPLPARAPSFPEWPMFSMGTAPPLTYSTLEQAYQACVIGTERPTMGVCSASFARQYGLVYDVDLDDR